MNVYEGKMYIGVYRYAHALSYPMSSTLLLTLKMADAKAGKSQKGFIRNPCPIEHNIISTYHNYFSRRNGY